MDTASQPAAPPSPVDRAHWTPARQRIFLAALLDHACVARAARAAGMSPSSAHRLRQRLAGTPFVRAWDATLAEQARRLTDPFAPNPARGAAQPSATDASQARR